MWLLCTLAGDGLFWKPGDCGIVPGQVPVEPLQDTDLRFVFVADGTFQQGEVAHLILQRAGKPNSFTVDTSSKSSGHCARRSMSTFRYTAVEFVSRWPMMSEMTGSGVSFSRSTLAMVWRRLCIPRRFLSLGMWAFSIYDRINCSRWSPSEKGRNGAMCRTNTQSESTFGRISDSR